MGLVIIIVGKICFKCGYAQCVADHAGILSTHQWDDFGYPKTEEDGKFNMTYDAKDWGENWGKDGLAVPDHKKGLLG